MSRGIFFSIDGVLALLLSMLLIASIFQIASALPSSPDSENELWKIGQDSLASMEKAGLLERGIGTSSTSEITEFLRVLPKNTCHRIMIEEIGEAHPLLGAENCACKLPVVSRRSFVVSGPMAGLYLAELGLCYK